MKMGVVEAICNFNRKLIHAALADLDGEIAIVWDHHISSQFNAFVSISDLRSCGVTKNFSLDKEPAIGEPIRHIAYFLAPLNASVTKLIKHIPLDKNDESTKLQYHVLFIPDANYGLKERFRTCPHVWRHVEHNIRSIPCHWFADDQPNYLQMALPDLSARMQLDGDWNYLYKCATALAQFRRYFLSSTADAKMSEEIAKCRPIDIFCRGKWAERIVDMMKKIEDQEEMQVEIGTDVSLFSDIDTVVVVDRWMDLVTPMLIPFTLGAAIDDLYEIDNQGKTKITMDMLDNVDEGEVTSPTPDRNVKPPKFLTLSGDVHERLQDLHIHELAADIRDLVAEIREEEKNREQLRSIADYKDFISERMPQLMQRKNWTDKFLKIAGLIQRRYADFLFDDLWKCQQEILRGSLTSGLGGEKPLPFIETAIAEAKEPHLVLRLIVLQSLVASRGLRPQVLASYRKAFVQTYGIFALNWWMKLQVAGMIREDAFDNKSRRFEMYPPTNYAIMAKRFRLIQTNVFENGKETDSAYAFNGYASLLVRLVEEGLIDNWRDFKKVSLNDGGSPPPASSDSTLVSGDSPAGHGSQESASGGIVPASIAASFSALGLGSGDRMKRSNRRIMLFVVGGITRAEAGALRHLNSENIRLCATTATITAKSLLESFK